MKVDVKACIGLAVVMFMYVVPAFAQQAVVVNGRASEVTAQVSGGGYGGRPGSMFGGGYIPSKGPGPFCCHLPIPGRRRASIQDGEGHPQRVTHRHAKGWLTVDWFPRQTRSIAQSD
jgi:hypothetical protein